jgi:hypothetical protein
MVIQEGYKLTLSANTIPTSPIGCDAIETGSTA